MLRRCHFLPAVLLATLGPLLAWDSAVAEGLYKGIGRRSADYEWTARVNGSLGFHGVEDPWDQFGVNSFPVGGYTTFGVEKLVRTGQSIELHGSYMWVNDSRNLVASGGPGAPPRPGTYRYEVDAWNAGGTWRIYYRRGASSGFFGFGGGWVFSSDLSYQEQLEGSLPFRIDARGNGPEVHALIGYDGIPGPSVRMGMELGFRYSWVDFDNGISGAGNFNGAYLGFRVGLVRR